MKSFERIIDMVSWWLDMTNEQALILLTNITSYRFYIKSKSISV